jgi:NAD(P)H-hydrate repair Nnr-like enzyme with NAD(P)H-hydrate epimerase domain
VDADAIVDGLFGTGSAGRDTSALSGDAADLVTRLLPLLDAPNAPLVVAVDIPSGIDADSGAVDGPVLPADLTVTFGALKAGLLQGPAAALAGRVELVDIGLADELAKVRPLLRR